MVGVPRSQGCRNCRRKKKGCDLQRPTCGQCVRLNLSCGWDDKKWTFVEQQGPATGSTVTTSRVPIRSRSLPKLRWETSVSPPNGTPERSLGQTALQIGLEEDFWFNFLPQQAPPGSIVGGVADVLWAKTIRDLATLDETTKFALNACALTMKGRVVSDPALLQEGTKLYAMALRETNKALQDPVRAQSDAVLASCKLLSIYEAYRLEDTPGVSTQGRDWHKHVEGTCRIVELRGPEKHVANHGHTLFEEARLLAVISGMTLRKPNFFTTAEWHTIPWETSPRTIRDELCDIMLALPQMLQKQDQLSQKLAHLDSNQDRFASLTEAQEHISRCVLIAQSLREWEQRTLSICIDQVSAREIYAGPVSLLEVCKNHGYSFFNMVMQFWVTSLVLYTSTWIAYQNTAFAAKIQNPTSFPTLMKLPEIPAWMNPRPIAANLTKCVPHYFADEAGYWGAQSSTFALGAALHYYAATGGLESTEMRELCSVMKDKKLGMVAGGFLRSMANSMDSIQGDTSNREEHRSMASSWFGTDIFERESTSTMVT